MKDNESLHKAAKESLKKAALWDEVNNDLNKSGMICLEVSSSVCVWQGHWQSSPRNKNY